MINPRADHSRWIAWLMFGALWFVLCRHLATHWAINPQYSFGWLVPPLAIYLAWRRWTTRPAPGSPDWRRMRWLIVSLALVFFPTWLVEQPNPDWRLVSWALGVEVVFITLTALAAMGGSRWLRHFSFPVCFILIAVPWPSAAEQPVIQGLMRVVAMLTVELLNLLRIPALQHGNLIEIGAGLLGIDEACSGVRSLQATLMASLFLGEMSRFDLRRRVFLVAAGVIVALACNVGRTFLLAWNAVHRGVDAIEDWHDPAGFTILTICFVIVWAIALFLSRGEVEPARVRDVPPASALPSSFVVGLAIWLAFVFTATELWFRSGPPGAGAWRIIAPPGSERIQIDARTAEMLQSDRTTAATWEEVGGRRWVLYFLEWWPGPSRSRILARMHRPEHCLPASGMQLVSERGVVAVEAGVFAIPFRAYTFEQNKRPVFVYFCLWQSRSPSSRDQAFDESTRRASLQAVLWRERNLGQQVAELALFGCANAADADAALRREVPRLIERPSP